MHFHQTHQPDIMNCAVKLLSSLVVLVLFYAPPVQGEVSAEQGKEIYQGNCSSCHQLGGKLVGPNLYGVEKRWEGREELLVQFIQNSQNVINGGDEYAQNLYNEYNQMVMPPMNLNEEEVQSVLAYISQEEQAEQAAAAPAAGGNASQAGGSAASGITFLGLSYDTTLLTLGVLALVLLVILLVLVKVQSSLNKLIWQKEHPGEAKAPSKSVLPSPGRLAELNQQLAYFITYRINPVFGVLGVIGAVVTLVAFAAYDKAQEVGSQQGYAPEQPIKFSHQIHAGQYQIGCQYCHTGVMKAKSANIPSTGVCMNCHNYINKGAEYGEEEIAKIYESNGYKPEDKNYNGSATWQGETEKPIEWVRIHNLPDHVYFNHAQHVNAGQLECTSCHGNMAGMKVARQVSSLEMGWCINCHRESEVNMENGFYQETYQFLENHEKYTVAEMGGLECSKCHY